MDQNLRIEQSHFSQQAMTYKRNLQYADNFFSKFAICIWRQMFKSFQLQGVSWPTTSGSATGPRWGICLRARHVPPSYRSAPSGNNPAPRAVCSHIMSDQFNNNPLITCSFKVFFVHSAQIDFLICTSHDHNASRLNCRQRFATHSWSPIPVKLHHSFIHSFWIRHYDTTVNVVTCMFFQTLVC